VPEYIQAVREPQLCNGFMLGYVDKYFSMALQPLWALSQKLYTICRTPWTSDQPIARPLPTQRTTQIQNKRTQKFMPQAGFERTIPAFERAKTGHALDRSATVIGKFNTALAN
jgi:hypothetical protein